MTKAEWLLAVSIAANTFTITRWIVKIVRRNRSQLNKGK